MKKALVRSAILFLFALLLPVCAPPEEVQIPSRPTAVEILVRVKGLPAETTALKVSAALNGKKAKSDATFTENLEQLGLRLPIPEGEASTIELTVSAIGSDGCKLATGHLEIRVSLDSPYTEVELTMTALPAKLCTVSVEKSGSGGITSDPAGLIDCGNTCETDVAVGTQLTLTAQRDGTPFLTEWGSACPTAQQYGTAGTCTLTVSGPLSIRARLVDDYCPLNSWCDSRWNVFSGVWGSDANNAWIVGPGGLIEKWNGSAWVTQTSGTTEDLRAVFGTDANNVWAVGSAGTVLYYNGTTWTARTSGTSKDLLGIWGAAANNLYAVGSAGTILHYDGTAWSTVDSGTTDDLAAIWGTGNTIWAVGNRGTIRRSTGTSWTAQDPGTKQDLVAIFGADATHVWAVGDAGTIT